MEDIFIIRNYIKFAEDNKIDLSKMYDPYILEGYKNFGIQDSIMRSTRMICSIWDLNYRIDTKEIFFDLKNLKINLEILLIVIF